MLGGDPVLNQNSNLIEDRVGICKVLQRAAVFLVSGGALDSVPNEEQRAFARRFVVLVQRSLDIVYFEYHLPDICLDFGGILLVTAWSVSNPR